MLKFIKKYACCISIIISILTFFVPIQSTTESTIYGFDMLLTFKTNGWWGIGCVIGFIFAFVFACYTIYFLILAIKLFREDKNETKLKHKRQILVFGFIFSSCYLAFGIIVNLLCWYGYKPWTLAFIPFLLQIPLYIVYKKNTKDFIK